MKKKPKDLGTFKPLNKRAFERLFKKTMRELQRSIPNSSLVIGPCRPCCWYHTPIC